MTVHYSNSRTSVIRALEQLTGGTGTNSWQVKRLGGGKQSWVFSCHGRRNVPIWHGHRQLVVKLYRPAALEDSRVIEQEFRAGRLLHDLLDGTRLDGWTIRAPVPLLCSRAPRALVTTLVPGRPLSELLRKPGQLSPEMLDSMAGVLLAALRHFWECSDRIYGDLNFKNILSDFPGRTLSFIDAGAPRNIYHCDAASRQWYPASRDLAYLLFEVAAAVRVTMFRPGFRQRQQRLAEAVLRCYLDGLSAPSQRASVLDEISQCARIHLGRIQVGGRWTGRWRAIVRQTATETIDELLTRLRCRSDATAPKFSTPDRIPGRVAETS